MSSKEFYTLLWGMRINKTKQKKKQHNQHFLLQMCAFSGLSYRLSDLAVREK